jgi:hypothetical protein
MFGTPALPSEPEDGLFSNRPAPPSDPAGGGHDQYFERLAKGLPAAPSNAPPPMAPPPPVYGGQSEFTRIISAVPQPPVKSPAPPPPAAAPPPKAPSNRVLLFGLIGVLVTAIIFVVVLAIIG